MSIFELNNDENLDFSKEVNNEVNNEANETPNNSNLKEDSSKSNVINFNRKISQDTIDFILDTVSLEEVIENEGFDVIDGETICPFHDDTNPSLKVNWKNTERYHCFVCNAQGNVFNFVMDYCNLNFSEAVEKIAKDFNIPIKHKNLSKEEERELEIQDKILNIRENLNSYFVEQFNLEENKEIKNQMLKRGFTEESLNEMQIGYAPSNYVEYIEEIRGDLSDKDLIKYEILLISKNNNTYAPLFNRITFPIYNGRKLLGFQGRKMDNDTDDKNPKYSTISSGLSIWNLNVARKYKEINVCEGIPDALTLIQNGHPNSIAILGTSTLDEKNMKLLNKVDKFYFWLDNDDAGIKASEEYSKVFGDKMIIVPVEYDVKDRVNKIEEELKIRTELLEKMDSDNEEVRERLNRDFKAMKDKVIKDSKDINGIFGLLDCNEKEFATFIEESKKEGFNYFEKKLKEWESIGNELEKATKLKSILEIAYEFYNGDSAILEVLKKDFKKSYSVSYKVFEEKIKEIVKGKKEDEKQLENEEDFDYDFDNWEIQDGVLFKNGYRVCSTVPTINKILRSEIDTTIELLISFTDIKGNYCEIIVPRVDIATKNGIVKTLNPHGFDILEKNALDIIDYFRYLESVEIDNLEIENVTERFGWHNDYKTFVIGNEVIGEQVIKFRGAGEGERQKALAYSVKGTFEEWIKLIPLIKNKNWVMFQLYQSFLPPLLPIIEATNYVYSNFGESSSGKTFTNRIACSVWASNDKNTQEGTAIINADKMTLDNLEKTLMLYTNVPVFLDDAHMLTPSVKSGLAYMVENGQGKSRGTIGRGTQAVRKIRTIANCTSEAPLVSYNASKNKGEQARIIELEGTPLRENNIELVMQIEEIIKNNFGIAGRMFIEKLMNDREKFEEIKAKHEEVVKKLISKDNASIVNRFTPLFAGAYISGCLANEYLELGLTEKEIWEDIQKCIKEVIGKFDTTTYSENSLDMVMDFFSMNRNQFLVTERIKNEDEEEGFDFDEDNDFSGKEMYGIWNESKNFIAVYRTVLENYLMKNNVDPTRCYSIWIEKEYIYTDKKKKSAVLVKNPITKKPERMIKFDMGKIEEYFKSEEDED